MTMQVGELLQYKEHVLQVCQSEANACTRCFAVGKQYVCNKMPDCRGGLYFKKIGSYRLKRAKKQGTNITKID